MANKTLLGTIKYYVHSLKNYLHILLDEQSELHRSEFIRLNGCPSVHNRTFERLHRLLIHFAITFGSLKMKQISLVVLITNTNTFKMHWNIVRCHVDQNNDTTNTCLETPSETNPNKKKIKMFICLHQ